MALMKPRALMHCFIVCLTITFELLNQLEDHKLTSIFTANYKLSQRVVDDEIASNGYGSPQYISHTALDFVPLSV